MAGKKINPVLKAVLELGPVLLFFIMFGRMKDQTYLIGGTEYSGFIVTTAAFVGLICLTTGVLWALTGLMVAAYTTYDAWGIRQAPDPFTFLAWFFVIDSILMPVLTFRRWRSLGVQGILPLLRRGMFGALVAFASFGGIMLATRLDKVGEAAVLRETSTVFAALIGWLVLGERSGRVQVALMAMIAAGAALVELGGR